MNATRMKAMACLLMASGFTGYAAASPIVITTDTGAGADAVVISSAPTGNFGTINNMRVGAYATSLAVAYTRFDLLAVTETVASAELSFAVNFNAEGNSWGIAQLFVLNDAHAGENWSETGITWNNAPANSGTGISLSADATLLSSTALDIPGTAVGSMVSYAGSNLVDAINADTDGVITFIVLGSESYSTPPHAGLAAREHATNAPPALSITMVPEPGSLAMVGSIVLLLVRRRRR